MAKDKLRFVRSRGGNFALLAGLLFLVAGALMLARAADESGVTGIVAAAFLGIGAAGIAASYRQVVEFDLRRRTWRAWGGVVCPFWRKEGTFDDIRNVRVSSDTDDIPVVFRFALLFKTKSDDRILVSIHNSIGTAARKARQISEATGARLLIMGEEPSAAPETRLPARVRERILSGNETLSIPPEPEDRRCYYELEGNMVRFVVPPLDHRPLVKGALATALAGTIILAAIVYRVVGFSIQDMSGGNALALVFYALPVIAGFPLAALLYAKFRATWQTVIVEASTERVTVSRRNIFGWSKTHFQPEQILDIRLTSPRRLPASEVEIKGEEATVAFGGTLTDQEKPWMVQVLKIILSAGA